GGRWGGHGQLAMGGQGTAEILGGQHAAGPAEDVVLGGSHRHLAVTVHQSFIPRIIQRTGEFLAPTNSRAEAPSLVRITRSDTPAPRLSMARSGSPSSVPSAASSCTSSKRQPCILGCFTVETAFPTTRPICMTIQYLFGSLFRRDLVAEVIQLFLQPVYFLVQRIQLVFDRAGIPSF